MYLNGSISILSKNGRFGAFNVGTLCTDIGDFVVKSELLDQLEPGTYQVNVLVGRIYLGGYSWGNTQNVTQLCAKLDHIECLSGDTSSFEADNQEFVSVDPVESEETGVDQETVYQESADALDSGDAAQILGDELSKAFLQQDIVVLDPTIGRVKLRAQTRFLKESGYKFDGSNKRWFFNQSV